jgi:hypothetical protein
MAKKIAVLGTGANGAAIGTRGRRCGHFPLTDAVEAFELGKQADKCIKITLHNKAT